MWVNRHCDDGIEEREMSGRVVSLDHIRTLHLQLMTDLNLLQSTDMDTLTLGDSNENAQKYKHEDLILHKQHLTRTNLERGCGSAGKHKISMQGVNRSLIVMNLLEI